MLWTQYFSSYKWFSPSLQEFECIKVSKIHFPLELKLIKCRSLSEMEESKRKENNIHSKEQHKYSTFFVPLLLHTHIYISLSSPSMNPPTSPTDAILFSTCFLCALKGSWGVLSAYKDFTWMCLLIYITQQSWGGRRKGQVIHFHSAGDT